LAARWDVVLVDFGDRPVGHEQGGQRPALIVSNDRMNRRAGIVTLCPFTSTDRELYPCEVEFSPPAGGLSTHSILMVHQVRTVGVERIIRRMGSIEDPVERRKVRTALIQLFDLQERP
jgi:mRNA interferase MazF